MDHDDDDRTNNNADSPKDDQATTPWGLFRLPPEIRNEIYSYIYPIATPQTIIRAKCGGLRWLSCSRELFRDAAPLFYTAAPFATSVVLNDARRSPSLRQDFLGHVELTYGRENSCWVVLEARKMVKRIVVTVIIRDSDGDCDSAQQQIIADDFDAYFVGVEKFVGLEKFCLRFGCKKYRPGIDEMGMSRNWRVTDKDSAVISQSVLHLLLQGPVDQLKQALPQHCEMQLLEVEMDRWVRDI